MPLDEQRFKEQFIASFLASWCAVNYTEYCVQGAQKLLGKPPVEDAIHLADEAWKHYYGVVVF